MRYGGFWLFSQILNSLISELSKKEVFGESMIYLSIFWVLFVLFFLLYGSSIVFKIKRLKHFFDNESMPFFIILMAFVIIAIATNDPVEIFGVSIPIELQWLASLVGTGFGAWKFYLHPLKNKVYEMDREVGEIKTSVGKVEIDVNRLTEHIINKKK